MTLASVEPVGRIEVRGWSANESGPARLWRGGLIPPWAVTVSTVNALLNTAEPVAPLTAPGLDASIASMLAVLDAEVRSRTRRNARGQEPYGRLYAQAMEVLRASAAQPSFTVDALACALSVSRRRLERAFEAHGTSAREMLKQERLSLARAVLAADHQVGIGEAARRSGFASPRALRNAMGSAPSNLVE